MSLDPVVVNITPPKSPIHIPKLPGVSNRTSKLITAGAAIVISISMVLFAVASVATNNKKFKQSHGITNASDATPVAGVQKSDAALPGGGTATGVGGTTGTNAPVVTLTAQPASVTVGGKSHLKWSVTNSPTSCTASDDWSGDKPAQGEADTPSLTVVQTYIFTLTCKTQTGTGFATVSIGATQQGGTGNVATRPTVHLAATPSSVYTGQDSTISWDVSNDPTSCTASGDWSGAKTPTGSASTGTLNSVKSYTYTLTCQNSAGSGFATATVSAVELPPDIPVVSLNVSPVGSVTPGSSISLSWTSINSPSSCTATGDWTGSKALNGSATIGPLNTIKTYTYTITCANSSGSSYDGVSVDVIPNAPSISLTVSPSTILVGSSATISWSATNSPTSCTASGSWSGAKAASGTQSTGTINSSGSYYYTLSCTNAGGVRTTSPVQLTVNVPPVPVVTISASPISITAGGSANISWSATNSPTSCTASGSWSGAKAASGTQSTGTMSTAGTYTYTLNCSNAGGSGQGSTSITVNTSGPSSPPVVTISVAPTSIGTGSSATVSWSATNSPTSCTGSGTGTGWAGSKSASGTQSTGTMNSGGSFTYSLVCSNGVGTSATATATLTVIAVPSVSISASPTTITTGSNTTISWTTTNSPTSCTASGNTYWSGSKGTNASNSQQVGPITTAGTYTFSITCSNTGGTSTLVSTPVTVNNAVYCSGNTPCYGPNDLAAHNTVANCWGYNLTMVFNITTFNSGFHTKNPASTNLLPGASSPLCGNANIASYLSGTNLSGVGSHNHQSSTKNNTNASLLGYRAGYYDASKP